VRTVPRAGLLAALAAGLPADTIRYGRPVTSVAVDADRVEVADGAGERYRPDVLVGADGYRSAVRREVLGDGPPADTGWISWQGLGPVLPGLAGGVRGVCLVGDAGLCGLMPAGGGLLQWWFDAPGRAADPVPDSPLRWLRERFGGYADPVPALLDAVRDPDVQRFPHVLHAVPDRWGAGPATLLGDAAHAFPPSQAQGANQALEDAWLLTRALRAPAPGDRAAVAAALRRYERRRARRVRRVARLAGSEVTNRPPTPPRRLAGRLLTPRLSGYGYLALLRSFSSVLRDERP
jgi:FAD-dependent urate hydroxylase